MNQFDIVEKGKLTEHNGRFYTAINVSNLEIGDVTQYGVVLSAAKSDYGGTDVLGWDDGCQHWILTTDLNPQGVRFCLGAEIIIEVTETTRFIEIDGYR